LDDGTLGLPPEAPFDAIVVAAGAEDLPKAYPEQLAESGRLLIPIGPPSRQQMVRNMRRGGKLQHEILGSFGFVPLVGDAE
jgi:protein-L-isoaspartate(D-aspartate) O-methyltransferase